MSTSYTLLSHTPLLVRVQSTTLKHLYSIALRGMFEILGPQIADEVLQQRIAVAGIIAFDRTVVLEADNPKHLLAELLSEALYLAGLHDEAYCNVTFRVCDEKHIKATLHGMPITTFTDTRVAGVRSNDIQLTHENGLYTADITFQLHA